MLSSTSSLATLSQAAVGNKLQGGTSRYNSPLDAPRAGSSFFRKRVSSSPCLCTKRSRGGILSPHHPGQSLGLGGGVSAPKGSLPPGSALFAGLLQPFVFCHEGLGVVAASNYLLLLNLIVLKIHHSEGGVSEVLMHPKSRWFLRFMAFGKVYQFTALCFGLSAAPQVFTWVMAPISEFLHSLGFGVSLICTIGYSGVLPRVGSSFSEDGPQVVQFSRNSRQLREVSACVVSEDVSSWESYWTLSVSGLLQPRNVSTSLFQLAPCFYYE